MEGDQVSGDVELFVSVFAGGEAVTTPGNARARPTGLALGPGRISVYSRFGERAYLAHYLHRLMLCKAGALPDFIQALRQESQGEIRVDNYSRVLYSTDASIYRVMPHGVFFRLRVMMYMPLYVWQQNMDCACATWWRKQSAGQAIGEAFVLDFTRHLNRIVEVNEADRWARVEPGMVLDRLNLDLAPMGVQFGPDPASSNRAAMGGIVSNNSTGSHSIFYGMTADHVLGMDVVLSDGSQVTLGPVEHEMLSGMTTRSGLEGKIYDGIVGMTAGRRQSANYSQRHPTSLAAVRGL